MNQRKGQPRRCFHPLSENIENLIKVFLTLTVRKTPAAPLKIFKYFLIHANTGPPSGQANALLFYEKIITVVRADY